MTRIQDALARLWDAADEADMLQYEGRWVRWGVVKALAEEIDRELTAAGCGDGGRVAVVLGNRMESVAAVIAILRSHRALVTISPLQPPARLGADLVASGASFVLAPAELWEEQVFADAIRQSGSAAWSLDRGVLVKRADATRIGKPADSDVAVEMLTSGTTGPPKRIPLTYRQLAAALSAALAHNNREQARDKPLFSGSAGLVTIPIVHIGGLWGLLQSLVSGRRFVMLDRFTLEGWHTAVKEQRPALVGLPPAALRSVLDADIPRADLASVRAVNAGTSPVDPALVDAFFERYGIPIIIVYGATEFCGAVAGWTVTDFHERWNDKKGSVGRAFPGVRLQVVDDDGNPVPAGRGGRLQVITPQAGDIARGWITTSDLAHIDDDGFLYIDGRADDVIVRGGFKVSPETVVKALRTHPAVADAAVAGMPDPRLGQVPVAAVELRAGTTATADELRAHCGQQLTRYEVPSAVFVVDELPRGAALKVDRLRLIAMLEERLTPRAATVAHHP